MKTFNYTTKNGTAVELIIYSGSKIKIKAKGMTLKSNGFIVYDFNQNPPHPALSTELKQNGKIVNVHITEEIKNYLNELKEKERIAALPIKEQLQAKINKLNSKRTFTYFVDMDLCTGIKWFALTKKVEKDVWDKIKGYFAYIDTTYHSDEFDAMYGSNYKGYLTRSPEKVEKILQDVFDTKETDKEIEKLEQQLNEILDKEQNDKEYRQQLFKGDIETLKERYPTFATNIDELYTKASQNNNRYTLDEGKIIGAELKLDTYTIIDTLLEKVDGYSVGINEPEQLVKVESQYVGGGGGGYNYYYKENKNIAVVFDGDFVVVCTKPKNAPEWWNVMMHDIVNGFFTPFGVCTIKVYKYKEKLYNLLENLGFKNESYGEVSRWFIVANKDWSGYKSDLANISNLSDDYNLLKTKDDVMKKYLKEKRWEWTGLGKKRNSPRPEQIKYIGKFKRLQSKQ